MIENVSENTLKCNEDNRYHNTLYLTLHLMPGVYTTAWLKNST